MSVKSGFDMLAEAGLVMQASLPVEVLPRWATAPMVDAGVEFDRYDTLILLGQGGTRLWEYISSTSPPNDSRFDETSVALAATLVRDHIGDVDYEIVYPGAALLPLGRLADLAGWGRPSPLGLTINEEFGLWLAHRVALLVAAQIPATSRDDIGHPCDSCADKPCITACPVRAVDATTGFDVASCTSFRIEDDSACAHCCLARLACPIGTEHRYSEEQMVYHYSSGLASIRRHYGIEI